MKYSVNPNLNAVMNSIEKQLLSKGKDKQMCIRDSNMNTPSQIDEEKGEDIEKLSENIVKEQSNLCLLYTSFIEVRGI